MNIGFDAKRAFHNTTGLGYYSRTLIRLLARYYPEHAYYLFNPRPSGRYRFSDPGVQEVLPATRLDRMFSSWWRSHRVKRDLGRLSIGLYHGLSHEVPIGIAATGIRSVVTIHDLIHERFPGQYNPIDVRIYSRKFRYACRTTDHIIATSEQTRQDILAFYRTNPEKITVCYQSCDPAFSQEVPQELRKRVASKYRLPAEYILYVGSVIERKNLLGLCRALQVLGADRVPPLVVVGTGRGAYYRSVRSFIDQQQLGERVWFLSERPEAMKEPDYLGTQDLAAIYQSASALVYPSFFEGFGLPVLEAISAGLPVITSRSSCLPEVGGTAAVYVDPAQPESIADALERVLSQESLRRDMIARGREHARLFAPDRYARSVMQVYQSIW
ncbi:MAG TPA: glycosyltransferase family 1 protein [Chitinophagaceae bacterium]|nr:glycosyltransferase family 1 protein [Chitinophagaceae bacterium]